MFQLSNDKKVEDEQPAENEENARFVSCCIGWEDFFKLWKGSPTFLSRVSSFYSPWILHGSPFNGPKRLQRKPYMIL